MTNKHVSLSRGRLREQFFLGCAAAAFAFWSLGNAATAGTVTPLYAFKGGPDGAYPGGNIAADSAGNLFGTSSGGDAAGDGTIFELSPPKRGVGPWKKTTLWKFDGATVGSYPTGVVQDRHGNLFGALLQGGQANAGAIYELAKTPAGWRHRILWQFGGSGDGAAPASAPIIGPNGVLFGTTGKGGANSLGAVYRLMPPAKGRTGWSETVLHSFSLSDGIFPYSSPNLDAAGNVYGESFEYGPNGGGSVWELQPPAAGGNSWALTVLYSPDSSYGLVGNLALDASGAVYGNCPEREVDNLGYVFKLTPPLPGQTAWTEQTVFTFGKADGGPAGVTLNARGDVFGFTDYQNGTIFELEPPLSGQTAWVHRTLWRFTGGDDGGLPTSPAALSAGRTITGATDFGGLGYGTVSRWTPK